MDTGTETGVHFPERLKLLRQRFCLQQRSSGTKLRLDFRFEIHPIPQSRGENTRPDRQHSVQVCSVWHGSCVVNQLYQNCVANNDGQNLDIGHFITRATEIGRESGRHRNTLNTSMNETIFPDACLCAQFSLERYQQVLQFKFSAVGN